MTDSEKLDLILVNMQEMKQDLGEVKHDIVDIKHDIVEMKQDVAGLKQDVAGLKQDVEVLKQDVEVLKQKVADLELRFEELNQRVRKIELTIDNEIRVNIQRVAEGHLDLSRNLHDAMKPSKEVEMLAIKVRVLESDMKNVKEKLALA